MDLLEKGLAASNFAMLGLGDIVIPGDDHDYFQVNICMCTVLQCNLWFYSITCSHFIFLSCV